MSLANGKDGKKWKVQQSSLHFCCISNEFSSCSSTAGQETMFQVDIKWAAKKRKPKSSKAEVKTNQGKKAQKPSLIKNRKKSPALLQCCTR